MYRIAMNHIKTSFTYAEVLKGIEQTIHAFARLYGYGKMDVIKAHAMNDIELNINKTYTKEEYDAIIAEVNANCNLALD